MAIVLTDWLHVATAAGALLSGLGLLGTMATVLVLVRQTNAIRQASVTSAYQSIIGMSSTFTTLLFEHPEVYHALIDPNLVVDRSDFREWRHRRIEAFNVRDIPYLQSEGECRWTTRGAAGPRLRAAKGCTTW